MTPAPQHARRLQAGGAATDHEDPTGRRARAHREIVLATRGGVADAVQRFLHEDVADAPVLIDARPDVVDPSRRQLVREVGIGEQLASHADEVGLAVGEHLLGLVRLEPAERDHRNVDS
jgi:hypothetical protein